MSASGNSTTKERMTDYERHVWELVNKHWERKHARRQLPEWASKRLDDAKEATGKAASKVAASIPEAVKKPIRDAGDAAANMAIRPLVNSTLAMLNLINDWARDLNDPRSVEKLARKQGLDLNSFTDLRHEELKFCDRLLTRHTLKWRTLGALEGGGMSLLAYIPVAGLPIAITADIVAIQALSNSIAARVSYSYGYDAKDPAEEQFIKRLVYQSFLAQAAKAAPLKDVANARHAIKGRVNWSPKLRNDHRLIAALEKLLKQLGPAGGKVPVKQVAKALPLVGILVGAGMNAVVLGNVASDAKRYCQTRFLCEKYDLPMPAALLDALDDDREPEVI